MRAVEALRKMGENGRDTTGSRLKLAVRFLANAKSEAQEAVQEDPTERLPEKCLFEPLYFYNVIGLTDNCTKKEVAEQLLAAQIEVRPIDFSKNPKKRRTTTQTQTLLAVSGSSAPEKFLTKMPAIFQFATRR